MKQAENSELLLINQEPTSSCLADLNVFFRHGTLENCGPGNLTKELTY